MQKIKQETTHQRDNEENEVMPRFHLNDTLTRLRPQMTRREYEELMTDHVLLILADPVLSIRQNYHSNRWSEILQYIYESYCRKCFIMNTQSNILFSISRIKFVCLKHLDLSNNNIINIQMISYLRIPQVRSINLSKNNIISSRPLQKTKWKNIDELKLGFNLLEQWNYMNRFYSNPDGQNVQISTIQSGINYQLEDLTALYIKIYRPILLSKQKSLILDYLQQISQNDGNKKIISERGKQEIINISKRKRKILQEIYQPFQ